MPDPFRLNAVGRLREVQRDAKRARLADALQALDKLSADAAAVASNLDALNAARRQALVEGRTSADRLLDAGRYELTLRGEQRVLAEQRGKVLEEVERRRSELAEADRQVKAIDTLRERHEAESKRRTDRREDRRLAEVAAQQHQRRRVSEAAADA